MEIKDLMLGVKCLLKAEAVKTCTVSVCRYSCTLTCNVFLNVIHVKKTQNRFKMHPFCTTPTFLFGSFRSQTEITPCR